MVGYSGSEAAERHTNGCEGRRRISRSSIALFVWRTAISIRFERLFIAKTSPVARRVATATVPKEPRPSTW